MTTSTEATEFINNAQSYAADAFEDARGYIEDAVTFAQGWATWNYPTIDFDVDNIDSPSYTDAPSAFTDVYVPPASTPSVPVFQSLHIPTLFEYPDAPSPLDTASLFQFARPDFDIGDFNEVAPEIQTDFDIGTAPSFTEPDAPEVRGITIPTVPDITLPSFDSVFEGVDPGAMSDVSQTFKDEYDLLKPGIRAFVDDQVTDWTTSYCPEYGTALARLEAKIDDGMDGGTVLSDLIEQQIFDRARGRVENEKHRLDVEIATTAGKRGILVPPATMIAGLSRAQQAAADNISKSASDTAVERAKLEIQHAQFIINASASLRQVMIGLVIQSANTYLQINDQAARIAQQTVEFAVDIYNAALALYDKKLDLYRISAQIFEVELKSALAEFEKVRAELDVANLTKDVERSEVDIYTKRIDAQMARVRFFLAELEGVDKQINQENLKLALYGEQARVYGIKAQAKESEFNGYRAAIAGDTGRVQAHAAEVRAYSAEVDAVASKSRADIAHADAVTGNNRNLVDIFRAEIASYQSDVDAESKRFDSSVRANRQQLDAYTTENNLLLETLKTDYERARLELNAKQTEFDGSLRSVQNDSRIWEQHVDMLSRTAVSAADVSKGLAAAALAAQNSLVLLANETVNTT